MVWTNMMIWDWVLACVQNEIAKESIPNHHSSIIFFQLFIEAQDGHEEDGQG